MRRLLVALALVAVATFAHAGTSGQDPTTGSLTGGAGGVDGSCQGFKVTLHGDLQRSEAPRDAQQTITASSVGVYACSIFRMPCTASAYTKIAYSIITGGAANAQSEVGIFSADGATRITSSGVLASTAIQTNTATVSAFTLTGGTQYLVCIATSVAATLQFIGINAGALFNNQYETSTFASGAGATQVAPMNDACTANLTPYTCCTGVDTGTCLGMADRVGIQAIVGVGGTGPLVVIDQ